MKRVDVSRGETIITLEIFKIIDLNEETKLTYKIFDMFSTKVNMIIISIHLSCQTVIKKRSLNVLYNNEVQDQVTSFLTLHPLPQNNGEMKIKIVVIKISPV